MKSMESWHFVILALACLAMMNAADAAPIDVPKDDPLVTIDFPMTWEIKHRDLTLQTGTAEKDLGFFCGSVVTGTKATKAEISETISQILEENLPFVGSFKLTGVPSPVEETVIDGSKAFKSRGKGMIGNTGVAATVYLLPVSKDRALSLAYWGTPEAIKKHEPLITKIIGSIQRKGK
jgi:hypothetical protein